MDAKLHNSLHRQHMQTKAVDCLGLAAKPRPYDVSRHQWKICRLIFHHTASSQTPVQVKTLRSMLPPRVLIK